MKYWIMFNGSPAVRKSFKELTKARVSAMNHIKKSKINTDHPYVFIVSAEDEPYDWMMNYKKVGAVIHANGMWQWCTGDEVKEILASGYTGKPIPKDLRGWRKG